MGMVGFGIWKVIGLHQRTPHSTQELNRLQLQTQEAFCRLLIYGWMASLFFMGWAQAKRQRGQDELLLKLADRSCRDSDASED